MFRGIDQRRVVPYNRRGFYSGKNVVSYTTLTFARAGSEYLRHGGTMTKQSTANQPATRNIGGRVFMQSEGALGTGNAYTEKFRAAISNWTNLRITVTDDSANNPWGDATADLITETVDTGQHYTAYANTIAFDGASKYFVIGVAKYVSRKWILTGLNSACFPGTPLCYFNLSDGTIYGASAVNDYGFLPLTNGWYFFYMSATSDVAASNTVSVYLSNDSYNLSYAGDITKSVYLAAYECVKTPVIPSYMYGDSSLGSKPKTQAHWTITEVPADHWMRERFYFELIAHHYDSVMAAAIGSGSYYLFDFDASAERIYCYLDFADNKIKWAGSVTGALGETAALTWSLEDKIKLWFTFDNGSNSTLRANGWGVDTTYTGTSCAAADGSVYWTMDSSEANHNHALQSEPEKF